MFSEDKIDKQIYEIEPGVFKSQSRAKSGETIYLTMELITANNKPHILQYLNQVLYLVGSTRPYVLSAIPDYIVPKVSGGYEFTKGAYDRNLSNEDHTRCSMFDYIKKRSGYSDEELQQLINTMGMRGLHKENKSRTDLRDTTVGSCVLNTSDDGKHYFVYASKDPNFSIQQTVLTKEVLTLNEFSLQYNGLLASVGFTNSDVTSSCRGVSRNPTTTIYDNYKGVAIVLIAFSGAIAKQFLNLNTMQIDPVGLMPGILASALEEGEFHVYRKFHASCMSYAEVKALVGKKTFGEPHFTILMGALNRIYKMSQCTSAELKEMPPTSFEVYKSDELDSLSPDLQTTNSETVKAGTLNELELSPQREDKHKPLIQYNRHRIFKDAAIVAAVGVLVSAALCFGV